MQFELNFYGIKTSVFSRDGFLSLSRDSVARLFDLEDTDELLAPLVPYFHDGLITLSSFEENFEAMVKHLTVNVPIGRKVQRENLILILRGDFIENIIKQLTYMLHALPLIELHDLRDTGIIDGQLPWSDESHFTPFTVSKLLGVGGVNLPLDVPFRYLIIKDESSSFQALSTSQNKLVKVIPIRYLSYVLTHNLQQHSSHLSRAASATKLSPYPHTCGKD